MLRHTVMEWTREWERNGREQGLKEGLEQGRREILVRQLNLKFGGLRPVDQVRIDAADAGQFLQWGDRVLTARSLDEVFES